MLLTCSRCAVSIGIVVACLISVTTCKKNSINQGPSSVNFLVIGDWGGLPMSPYWTAIELAIAQRIGTFVTQKDVQFLVALGDNFYYNGVKDVEDRRFQETYEAVFNEPSLAHIDWYLIAGNHDHNGNVSAQIAFSQWEKRWHFPSFYYSIQVPSLSNGMTIDFLMLDTIVLCGNSDSDFLNEIPPGPANGDLAEQQWQWLEQRLQNSQADYLLVGGHYPVLSIGRHGPTKCLVDRLMPLLHKYSVTAYLCGHDHNMQHLEYTMSNATVQYFLSGAANFIDQSRKHEDKVPAGSSKYFWADQDTFGGFGYVTIDESEMTYFFYNSNGTKVYSKSVPPRGHA